MGKLIVVCYNKNAYQHRVALPALKSQFSSRAEISRELLNGTTLEMWVCHVFCGIKMIELLLHSIIKPYVLPSATVVADR